MGRINRLSSAVYNRISAGEVVENPASVVKELVENAIDAGSTEITVTIENGGIKSIMVADNGCGMDRDDLRSCLLLHATSKISCAEDLDTISTLGFRGEALAGIAAVSQLTIASIFAQAEQGYYIQAEGGEIIEEGESLLQAGTALEVNSLFYNTPARFRFLKSPKGEESLVTKVMCELILANPDISFCYVADGKTIYMADGDGLESAVCTVFGVNVAQNLLPFSMVKGQSAVRGYTARPASEAVRNNKNYEVFIVNGRMFSDSALQAVVANAYGEKLMHRTFPTVILDIILPFEDVDVNVHPNKREVRFVDDKVIYGLVYHAIKEAIEKDERERSQSVVAKLCDDRTEEGIRTEGRPESDAEKEEIEEPATSETDCLEQENISENDTDEEESRPIAGMNLAKVYAEGKEYLSQQQEDYCPVDFIFSEKKKSSEYGQETGAQTKLELPHEERRFNVVGQIFDTYILVESGEEVYLIDQHAAHERMLFNRFVEETKKKVAVQDLLLPRLVYVEREEVAFFAEHTEDFRALGFDIETESDGLVRVLSVPTLLTGMDITLFIRSVDTEKRELKDLSDLDMIRSKIAQKACKSAIKGGDKLNNEQVEYFIKEYLLENAPQQCPHGRPVLLRFTKYQIEKMFGRVQ